MDNDPKLVGAAVAFCHKEKAISLQDLIQYKRVDALIEALSPLPIAEARLRESLARQSPSGPAAPATPTPTPAATPPARPAATPPARPAAASRGACSSVTSAATPTSAAPPSSAGSVFAGECPIDGLRELLEGAKLTSAIPKAIAWCAEMGADSVSEIREAEAEEDFVNALELLPLKKALLLKRLAAA